MNGFNKFDMYLSYSRWKMYQTCPSKYKHCYISKTPVVKDPRSSFLGSSLGKILEWFYSEMLWKNSNPEKICIDRIDAAISDVFTKEKWDPNIDSTVYPILTGQLRTMIPDSIEIIRSNGFLTPYSRAEVDLTVIFKHAKHNLTLKMGGRCDFIHGKDRSNIWILDGKASKYREKYVDSNQLIWYAIQHYIKYNVMPQRLGFIFWAFPQDPLSWIEFNNDIIHQVTNDIFDVCKKIQSKIFHTKPSKECNMCDYRLKCEDSNEYLSLSHLESGGRIVDSIFILEDISSGENK
jgi:hypothetical protein